MTSRFGREDDLTKMEEKRMASSAQGETNSTGKGERVFPSGRESVCFDLPTESTKMTGVRKSVSGYTCHVPATPPVTSLPVNRPVRAPCARACPCVRACACVRVCAFARVHAWAGVRMPCVYVCVSLSVRVCVSMRVANSCVCVCVCGPLRGGWEATP